MGMTQYYIIRTILTLLPEISFYKQITLFLLTELNLFSFYLLWRAFVYALMVLSVVIFPTLELFRVMLFQLKEQISTLLQESESNQLSNDLFLQSESRIIRKATFRREYTKVVVLVSRCSSSYIGRGFLPYLLLNSTANAVLLITLFSSHSLSLFGQIFVVCFTLDETVGLFQVHLALAQLNSRLKRLAILYCFAHTSATNGPERKLRNRRRRQFSLAGQGLTFSQQLHQQLCSWLFIEKFAITTNRVYGFKYRQFGRIRNFNKLGISRRGGGGGNLFRRSDVQLLDFLFLLDNLQRRRLCLARLFVTSLILVASRHYCLLA